MIPPAVPQIPVSPHDPSTWHTPPPRYAPAVRRLTGMLDHLPWPLGEDGMAVLGIVNGFVRPDRLRRALAWAAARHGPGPRRWPLALSLLGYHGRFIAQQALVGIRAPALLHGQVSVDGEERLRDAARHGGVLLLGFHLGPPGSALALRLRGHPVTFVGDPKASGRSARGAWRPFLGPETFLSVSGGDPATRSLGLGRAVDLLSAGRALYLTADGPLGAQAFRISLAGGPIVVRAGWLALRRRTGATTLPVLAHMSGRRHTIVIHAPLPPPDPDPARDRDRCRGILAPLLRTYVDRFPGQCPSLALTT